MLKNNAIMITSSVIGLTLMGLCYMLYRKTVNIEQNLISHKHQIDELTRNLSSKISWMNNNIQPNHVFNNNNNANISNEYPNIETDDYTDSEGEYYEEDINEENDKENTGKSINSGKNNNVLSNDDENNNDENNDELSNDENNDELSNDENNDELSNDELSNDELSNDENNDELSNDDENNDELSNDNKSNDNKSNDELSNDDESNDDESNDDESNTELNIKQNTELLNHVNSQNQARNNSLGSNLSNLNNSQPNNTNQLNQSVIYTQYKLRDVRKGDLQKICKELGVPSVGKRDVLISNILNVK